eukprot:507407-Rhodomonas_salina.2
MEEQDAIAAERAQETAWEHCSGLCKRESIWELTSGVESVENPKISFSSVTYSHFHAVTVHRTSQEADHAPHTIKFQLTSTAATGPTIGSARGVMAHGVPGHGCHLGVSREETLELAQPISGLDETKVDQRKRRVGCLLCHRLRRDHYDWGCCCCDDLFSRHADRQRCEQGSEPHAESARQNACQRGTPPKLHELSMSNASGADHDIGGKPLTCSFAEMGADEALVFTPDGRNDA